MGGEGGGREGKGGWWGGRGGGGEEGGKGEGGGTENWAPLPRVFHNTDELGSMRHESETASVMSALVRSMA